MNPLLSPFGVLICSAHASARVLYLLAKPDISTVRGWMQLEVFVRVILARAGETRGGMNLVLVEIHLRYMKHVSKRVAKPPA